MRRILLVIMLLFFSMVNVYNEEQKIYRNSYFNFTMNYPASWKIKEISGLPIFTSPLESESDDFPENVNVGFEKIAFHPQTTKTYWEKKGIPELQNQTVLQNIKIIERGRTNIGKKEASYITYIAYLVMYNTELKFRQYAIIVGSNLYLFTYTAKEADFYKFLPQAEGIIMSFRITQ